jgi:hypothetical protein
MGVKSPQNFQSDRPESGGADRDENLEKSGILEREQQVLETKKAEEREQNVPPSRDDQADGSEERDDESDDEEGEGRGSN